MAGEERTLSGSVSINIDGVIGFVESFRNTTEEIDRKRITDGNSGHEMEQTGRKKLPSYEGTLMAPAANLEAFVEAYREGTVLDSFENGVDSPAYLAQFGDYELTKCNWDAAILENDILKVSITVKAKGYGTTTDVGVI